MLLSVPLIAAPLTPWIGKGRRVSEEMWKGGLSWNIVQWQEQRLPHHTACYLKGLGLAMLLVKNILTHSPPPEYAIMSLKCTQHSAKLF